MKAPVIAAIPEATPQTSFTEKVRQAKKASPPVTGGAVKRSFSIGADDADYIDSLALKLGTQRGKTMSVSEALRTIIADHRKQS